MSSFDAISVARRHLLLSKLAGVMQLPAMSGSFLILAHGGSVCWRAMISRRIFLRIFRVFFAGAAGAVAQGRWGDRVSYKMIVASTFECSYNLIVVMKSVAFAEPESTLRN